MSNDQRNIRNQESRSFNGGRDPGDRHHGRLGGIARKSVEPMHPRLGLATKAARKTFAQPQSDSDSQEDEHSDRSAPAHRHGPSAVPDRPLFVTKSGQTMSAISRGKNSNQPTSKGARRVTFNPDAQTHSSASGIEKRPVPVGGTVEQNLATPSQTRPSFVSKSATHTVSRRDPFAGGTPNRNTGPIRLSQSYSSSSLRPAYGSGISNQRFPIHPTHSLSSSSNFPSTSAGESISSAGRRKGNRFFTPPSKSRPLPPLEAIEDATWRKSSSSRKTFVTYSGIKPAPRMTAPSMSTPRNATRSSITDQIRSGDVGPTVFLGRNMTVYENNVADDSDVEEISTNAARQRLTARAKADRNVMPTMQTGRKAGNYGKTLSVSSSSDSSEESSEDASESSEDKEMDSAAEGPDTGSDDEAIKRPTSPSNNLIAALEVFILPSLRMQKTGQLPFLLRNLRRGFADRCLLLGLSTKPTTNSLVSEDAEGFSDEYKTRMTSWNCPLCDLHGGFGVQAMLQKHIEWDHSEIETRWMHDNESVWTIILYVPKPYTAQDLATVSIHKEIRREPSQLYSPPPSAAIVLAASPDQPIIPPAAVPSQESPVHSKLKQQPTSPRSAARFTSQTLSNTRSRSVTLASSRSQTREPSSQPPLEDPLGPSAQEPYLPENSEGSQVSFSCRPGGPRIYDLLNTLPLAPFGVLSWFIIDREEELFELDDVLDEDKVMQALWGRWILLNHRKFLANYYDGTTAFVDEYWRMIHRAAGWAALRVWLLMFVVNRFLTGSEVARILRHYEGLTNMDSWYTNEE